MDVSPKPQELIGGAFEWWSDYGALADLMLKRFVWSEKVVTVGIIRKGASISFARFFLDSASWPYLPALEPAICAPKYEPNLSFLKLFLSGIISQQQESDQGIISFMTPFIPLIGFSFCELISHTQ